MSYIQICIQSPIAIDIPFAADIEWHWDVIISDVNISLMVAAYL